MDIVPTSALRRGIEAAAVGGSTRIGSDMTTRRYRFPADFAGFDGHFPGDPILPAVVQLQTVVVFAQELAGMPLRLVAVRSAKFLSPIRPDEDVEVRCRHDSDSGSGRYDAILTVGDRTVSSFSLELAADTNVA